MFSNPLESTECQLSFPWAESGSQGCAGEIVKPMSQGFDPLAKEAVPVCRLCWWCHSEDVRRLTVLRLRLTEIHFQGQTTVLWLGKSCNWHLYELNRAGSEWTAISAVTLSLVQTGCLTHPCLGSEDRVGNYRRRRLPQRRECRAGRVQSLGQQDATGVSSWSNAMGNGTKKPSVSKSAFVVAQMQ